MEESMGQSIDVRRPDGRQCPAYLSAEGSSKNSPGLVVIQEWWGLNEQIQKTGDRFARAGYRVLVPDLFRGKIAKDGDEASHLMERLNFKDAAEQDIQGCVSFLRESSQRCGVTGFCMGGALTLLSALRVKGVDAGACFYGIPPRAVADPREIAIPLILHFANTDDWCTPQLVDGLKQDLEHSRSRFELHRYDAQHAFMNEARPEVYDADAAQLAWERTLAFFERTLKS
jgi:carboxymethylenebutenolidase